MTAAAAIMPEVVVRSSQIFTFVFLAGIELEDSEVLPKIETLKICIMIVVSHCAMLINESKDEPLQAWPS
jgi:hypothetical protein